MGAVLSVSGPREGLEGADGRKSMQHAPVMRLGEPYAYSYNSSDPADLIAKLRKAASTPIPQ